MTFWGENNIMLTWKSVLLAGAMAMTPMIAHAAHAPEEAPMADVMAAEDAEPAVDTEAQLAAVKAKMQREMDDAIAMVEKLFDTGSLPPIDPARLALAQGTTAALVPAGGLEKMLDNLYGKLFRAVMEQAGGASDLTLSIKTGVESDKIAALDAPTKNAIADLFDPHRKEREDQITNVIKPLISEVLTDMEQPMRDGMARAYARKFSADQLTQFNGFFATPAGAAYASEWMALQADPEVMLAMIKAVPPLITKFIDRAPKIEGQMKDLPKEKSLTDMSDAELAKLAKLMKVDVKVLKDNRDMWSTETVDLADAGDAAAAAEAAAAAATAAATADDTDGFDPSHDRANWSDADRQRVEELEAAADSASSAAYDAQQEAITNASKRLGNDPSTE